MSRWARRSSSSTIPNAATRTQGSSVASDADEPAENAQLLADLYLADPSRGCCRRLTTADLTGHTKPPTAQTEEGVRWQTPLIAGVGEMFRLRVLDDGYPVLRWVRERPTEKDPSRVPVSLRCVVGELQDYEPAVAMTRAAIREHQSKGCSVVLVRGELQRLMSSAIVLNRRLREHVEHTVKTGGVSMSEIAIRCGRVKKDRRGREAGETSWLARRIGQLPEAGQPRPTPWVHSEVLARIARDGLGITPQEAELPLGDAVR